MFSLETLTNLSVANLMMIGSVVAGGVAIFLLVRTLYPEQMLREVGERAAEARERQDEARARGYVPPPPPGKLKAFGGAFVEKIGNLTEEIRTAKEKYDGQKEEKRRLRDAQQKVIDEMAAREKELRKLKDLRMAINNNVSPKKYYK